MGRISYTAHYSLTAHKIYGHIYSWYGWPKFRFGLR
jgi:hypothetical protein